MGLLLLLLVLMVGSLVAQLRSLSSAQSDDMQWSIGQLDTEFANLSALLSRQLSDAALPEAQIALRADIALSRLNILNSGSTAELFRTSAEAQQYFPELATYADKVIAILDEPAGLTRSALTRLRDETEAIRPTIRQVTLLGVRIGAENSDLRRAEFSRQLARTGSAAVALIVVMGGLLIVLDRLLRRADERDAKLLASSRQLASTIGASLDAIVTADGEGKVTDFNDAAEKMFGWTRAEILGKPLDKTIIPHRMRTAHKLGMSRYMLNGQRKVVDGGRVEMVGLRKSGFEFPLELNINSVEIGGETRFVGYLRDISLRKYTEKQLIDARDRAEQMDKAKSKFLAIMSHEMRTPLNGILGILDLLKTTKIDDKQAHYVRVATASSEILLEQINEALDITRIESGAIPLVDQAFDAEDLIASLVDVLTPLAEEKDLDLAAHIADSATGEMIGDGGRIRQILTNLIGNAIKFTETGGITIYASTTEAKGWSQLSVSVSDTGPGIPPDERELVFEDFVTLSRAEDGRQVRGDGLGLSISRRIARQMQGDLVFEEAEGGGAKFTLTLPVRRGAGKVLPLAPDRGAMEEMDECHVLVVEDNSVNRRVLGDMLRGMDHIVHEAINGVDCLEKANGRKFNVIFMDISMPIMDGIEATRRLRNDGGLNSDTTIIGLTAHGREEYRLLAEDAGMNRFQTKPIRLEVLRKLLDGPDANSSETMREGIQEPAEKAPVNNTDALQELAAALGANQVQHTVSQFFDELEGLMLHLPTGNGSDLADHSHKMKGAASLLGFVRLERSLTELEVSARAGLHHDRDQLADGLRQVADQEKRAAKDHLTRLVQ